MRTALYVLGAISIAIIQAGCGSPRKAAHPSPTYERWELPPWTPPDAPSAAEDPTADLSAMEGEWATDSEEERANESEAEPPESPEPQPPEPNSAEIAPEDEGKSGESQSAPPAQ